MIKVDNLCIDIGEFSLKSINLNIEKGDYFTLLGPTGAGKTVFIECLCGLHKLKKGRIFIDDVDVTDFKPEDMRIGYVPQDYALFTHMNVYGNITYGLWERKLPRNEIDKHVTTISEMLNVKHLLHRRPGTLSGGEAQRVALARALVVEPLVLLLDEPLSALDESTRQMMAAVLKRVHNEIHTTTIHVTHNFEEMFMLGEKIGIFYEGQLLQTGASEDVFRHPNSRIIAFLRVQNIWWLPLNSDTKLISFSKVQNKFADEEGILVCVRPEDVKLSKTEPKEVQEALQGKVVGIMMRGPLYEITVETPQPIVVLLSRQEFLELGCKIEDKLYVWFQEESVHQISE